MLSITEALTQLVDESGESALLLVHPDDGMGVVVRGEDEKTRLAFIPEEDDEESYEGDRLALWLIRRAAAHQRDQAKRRVEGRRAIRLHLLVNKIDSVLERDEPEDE
jgi:hypothetical protein